MQIVVINELKTNANNVINELQTNISKKAE